MVEKNMLGNKLCLATGKCGGITDNLITLLDD
jgi:hypothetical protein